MVIGTIADRRYLSRAMTLAESVRRFEPGAPFVMWLLERELPKEVEGFPAFDRFLPAADGVSYPFDPHLFRFGVVEAATALKADLFAYMFREFPDEREFLFLDPDVRLYDTLDPVREALATSDLVLTPHQHREAGDYAMEIGSLQRGIHNLGFLGVRRSEEGERFLAWFLDRLRFACYDLKSLGIFTDQKWFDLAPVFFPCRLLRDPGLNLAPWNFRSRPVLREGGRVHADGSPLRFIHFSGFPHGFDACLRAWAGNDPILAGLRDGYAAELARHEALGFVRDEWSYARYRSGRPISDLARFAWRRQPFGCDRDPFALSDRAILGAAIGSFAKPLGRLYRTLRLKEAKWWMRTLGVELP